jgi:hypothetical protein
MKEFDKDDVHPIQFKKEYYGKQRWSKILVRWWLP